MAPVIKRGIGTFTTGRAVALFIDTNLAGSAGSDVTGTAKIYLNLTQDASRTTFVSPTPIQYTPPVAPASSTRYAVASMAIGTDDSIWVAWQGVDNALYVSKWTYNTTTHAITFVSTSTVVAAGAITNRFRSIDIDMAGASPFIMTYEARTTDGNGADHRVYALKSDGTTWIRCLNIQALGTGQFIRANSEDVSIAVRGDYLVSNAARFVIYGTKTYTSSDLGDVLREYTFNISTGTADNAGLVGTWYTSLNKSNAAGSRRAILFTINSAQWVFGGVYGTSSPRFFGAKMTTNDYSAPVWNYVGYVAKVALSSYFKIDSSYNPRTAWSATYKDNRLIFGFASYGPAGTPRIAREIVMAWGSPGVPASRATFDSIPRPMDANRYADGGPIGVYGGDNRRTNNGLKAYNFQVLYGRSGNTVSTSWDREVWFVAEDTFNAPVLVSPASNGVEATNWPTYRVRVDNLNLTPNLYGKIELQIASDTAFTTSVHSIVQADSAYQFFGSKDGLNNSIKVVTIPTGSMAQALVTGTWYWRARIVSDKDTPGAWSDYGTFSVSHPPVAKPINPKANQVIANLGSSVYFTWSFSDTESKDAQTQYRVQVLNDSGLTPVDSGWVVSSLKQFGATFTSGYNEVPQRWTVQLRDLDGTTGPESDPVTFLLGTIPTVSILTPASSSVVTTAAPTITWSYSSAGGRVQRSYRVFITATTGPLTGTTVADSGWVTSASASHTFASNVLQTGVGYQIWLTVNDEAGLQNSSMVAVTTDWIEPALPTTTLATDTFKVRVSWTNAAKDPDWVAWRVYRRYMKAAAAEVDVNATAYTWVLLYETQDDLTSYTYDDYLCPLNKNVDYVVVQLADRFGSLLESNITSYQTTSMSSDRFFFVPSVPVGTIASFQASDVTGDQFTRDVEQETLHVVGRGRQVQVGDDLGYSGTLQLKLRNPSTARLTREFLEILASTNNSVYIKSPFGDVFLVAFGNMQTSRLAGVGRGDLVDVSIPYTQIIEPDQITRL